MYNIKKLYQTATVGAAALLLSACSIHFHYHEKAGKQAAPTAQVEQGALEKIAEKEQTGSTVDEDTVTHTGHLHLRKLSGPTTADIPISYRHVPVEDNTKSAVEDETITHTGHVYLRKLTGPTTAKIGIVYSDVPVEDNTKKD